MNPIAEIKTRLAKYSGVTVVETASSIKVMASDETGFPVTFQSMGASFTVYFAGWHEEFTSAHDALDCFAFGLSSDCRLRVVLRGQTPTKWIVESRENGAWLPDSETGLLFVPFWLRRREVYLQNHLIAPAAGAPPAA